MGGQSTGYMEILGGVGYSKNITNHSNIQAKVSLGAAGGGEVDTGGGAISKASLNYNINPYKNMNIGLEGGYYHALEGNFDATFAKVQLGFNTNLLSVGSTKSTIDLHDITTQKFNIRLSNQTYLYSNSLSNDPTHKNNVNMLGIKVDWFMTDKLYATGQAFGAYGGDAGGYAVGMFGVGYIQPLAYRFSAVAEIGIGAGGGGSINSGGGNITQPMTGIMYAFTKSTSIEVMYGRVIALNGDLNANIIDVGLVYKFNKLVMK